MAAFTSNFDRAKAGFSPGRVDALVWALSDLMVQPMPSYGIFEFYRQKAMALAGETESPKVYARGSVQWQKQQAQGKQGPS